MAILKVLTDTIGQTGNVPRLIYVTTNSTFAQVEAVGYLNVVVTQGTILRESDMALVSTKTDINSPISDVGLYDVVFAAGQWSLVPYMLGLITGAANLGTGEGTFANTVANILNFKSLKAGAGITLSSSPTEITITSTNPSDFAWVTVPGVTQALDPNMGYIPLNAGLTTFTLPVTCTVGSEFQILGSDISPWLVAQNAGQSIIVGNETSTIGVTGSISSTDPSDGIRLVCIVANTKFAASFLVGNITIS